MFDLGRRLYAAAERSPAATAIADGAVRGAGRDAAPLRAKLEEVGFRPKSPVGKIPRGPLVAGQFATEGNPE